MLYIYVKKAGGRSLKWKPVGSIRQIYRLHGGGPKWSTEGDRSIARRGTGAEHGGREGQVHGGGPEEAGGARRR